VRLYPAEVAGDVGWASVELAAGGGLAVVFDDSALAVVEGRLVAFRGVAELVDAVVAYVRGGVRLNAIEVVCDALPYVGARIAVDGAWWRASFWGIWEPWTSVMASGASINLGGDEWSNVVQLTQLADGVEVRTALRRDEPARVTLRGQLPFVLERIVADVRAAIDTRAAFRARPFSVRTVGERLLRALAQKSWKLRVHEPFPSSSSAEIWHEDDLGEHFDVLLDELRSIVRVCGRELRSEAELERALPALVAEIRLRASQLSADKLRPGATYRVLRALKGVAVGQRVTFFKVEHYPHDGGSRWIFGGSFDLWDQYDADCEILRDLHQYLALDLPA
jgi:hypothetical protein